MLDLIQTALTQEGLTFQRIDGQKSLEERERALEAFDKDPVCTVMLASIGSVAEGYGLNLVDRISSLLVLRQSVRCADSLHLI